MCRLPRTGKYEPAHQPSGIDQRLLHARVKDITKATPQEMRSLVCAQCHVEYYFKGDGKYLTFPWDKGSTVEDMEAYYDEAGFY